MRLSLTAAALAVVAAALCACGPSSVDPDASFTGCNGQGRSRCVASVSFGARFGCALLGDQTVWCWGRNDESQLGYDTTDVCPERLGNGQTRAIACHTYPLQVTGLAGATAISVGGAHTCVLHSSGGVQCWGSNSAGQLGNGLALPSGTPVMVNGITRATSVASGARHACAVSEGRVLCWGANDRGQLGVPMSMTQCEQGGAMAACSRTPVVVTSVSGAVEVVAGDSHSCARTQSGRVQCWGANEDGQLGAGMADGMPTPRPQTVLLGASALTGVRALAAGSQHTCASRENGAVVCWGRHDRGQLGVPVPPAPFAPCANACITTAVPVTGYEGTSSGGDPDGGFEEPEDGGTMGTPDAGAMDASVTPRDGGAVDAARDVIAEDSGLPPPPTVAGISAGGAFSCLALSDGTIRCWGTNRNRELGNGELNEGGPTLVTVIASPGAAATNPLQNVRGIESGGATSCAVLSDRSLRCWGSNETGSLGIGSLMEQSGPVPTTW